MSRPLNHSMRVIRWIAVFRETVRHAYFRRQRICAKVMLGDPNYWVKTKKQPRKQCRACRMRLANALQVRSPERASRPTEDA